MQDDEPYSPRTKQISWFLNEDFELIIDQSTGTKRIIAPNKDAEGNYMEIEFQETLGQGRFCKVKRALGSYEAEDSKNIPYAIKIYNKTKLKKITCSTMEKMCTMLEKTDAEIEL